ncbi:MAG: flavodoxin-dependent (E)-4-hydroxy-3-methylbut-2-enyl-diphosphate synthase, partial [Dolichospermum sp.]
MQTLSTLEISKTTSSQPTFDTTIKRRKTRAVKVGDVIIGGGYPVVVQSMINEDTLDIDGSVAGIRR